MINKKEELYKKSLITLSVLIGLMGIFGIFPEINISIEPIWYSIIKIGIGLFGLIIALKFSKKNTLALYLIGGTILLIGLVALVPGLNLSIESEWYAISKVIIGVIAIYITIL